MGKAHVDELSFVLNWNLHEVNWNGVVSVLWGFLQWTKHISVITFAKTKRTPMFVQHSLFFFVSHHACRECVDCQNFAAWSAPPIRTRPRDAQSQTCIFSLSAGNEREHYGAVRGAKAGTPLRGSGRDGVTGIHPLQHALSGTVSPVCPKCRKNGKLLPASIFYRCQNGLANQTSVSAVLLKFFHHKVDKTSRTRLAHSSHDEADSFKAQLTVIGGEPKSIENRTNCSDFFLIDSMSGARAGVPGWSRSRCRTGR